MIPLLKFTLLTVAVVASCDAVIAFAAQMEADTYSALLFAILALGGVFAIDHAEHESRRRLAEFRKREWGRREMRP